jgi:hypothetical protein
MAYSSSYTQHVSALILYLFHVFYALKHIWSEMIEISPPYYVWSNFYSLKNCAHGFVLEQISMGATTDSNRC